MSGIIRTKLNIPVLSKNVIVRKKLEEKMRLIPDYEITMVTAPAGYGKTTAVAQYLTGSDFKTAWFSIDETDNDPVLFWQYVITAFSDAFNGGTDIFADLTISREIAQSNIISKLLLDRLCRISDQSVFVIDDFHLIDNPAILSNLKYMAKYMPENISILLTSRRTLEDELAALLSKGRVLSIGSGDLAFDTSEITEFYEKRGILLNSMEASRIFEYTEGWAAGLVLSSIAADKTGIIREASAFSNGKRQINRLLSDEVFFRWPERVKRFLIQTCALDRFSSPLCRAVTGFDDSGEIIKILAESNSFLMPLDDDGEWYRYHHLFSEFLKTKLEQEDRQMMLSLYQKAGQWYCQNGYMKEAVDALVKGEDYVSAMRLFWQIFVPIEGRGESATLLGWMEGIPPEVHKYSASFCFIIAYQYLMEGMEEKAEFWYTKAEEAFNNKNYHMFDDQNPEMVKKLLLLCKSGLAQFRMDVQGIIGCYIEASKFNLPPSDHGETNAYQPTLLKTMNTFMGRLKMAEEAYFPIHDYLLKCHDKTMAYFSVGTAELLYQRNCLDECAGKLTESLGEVLDLGYSGATVPHFLTLARLRRARGEQAGALETVAGCRKMLCPPNALWSYVLDIFEADLHLDTGDFIKADRLLRFDRMDIYDEISATNEFELYTFAKYLSLSGSADKAVILLSRLDGFAEKRGRVFSRLEVLCRLSSAYGQSGRMNEAVAALQKALELGMDDGYIRVFLDEPRIEKVLSRYINERKTCTDEKRNYAKKLYRLMANRPKAAAAAAGEEKTKDALLSKKELQVLKLMVNGCSNLEIASELGISENTVKYHNSNIFSKLDVKSRQNAVRLARETGLVK